MYTKKTNFLYRNIIARIKPWIERDEIIVILGARQVGKTSLLHYLKDEIEKKAEKTFFIDLEDLDLRAYLDTPRHLLSYLEALGWRKGERAYLFLDELHYMRNASSILKYIHDHYKEIKVIATGSSSLRLKFKLEEPLTGRKVVFTLFTLSFPEYLHFTGKDELKKILEESKGNPIPEPFISRLFSAYEEYLIYGGYPKVALEHSRDLKQMLLKEIHNTYMDKELRSFLNEESLLKFKTFIEFTASQNSGLMKVSEISKEVGISRVTVYRYLTILEETFIIGFLRPYFKNRQKEITHLPKLYFMDTGFLNFTIKDFRSLFLRKDAGSLLETSIFTSILRNLNPLEELKFYRTKRGEEIDFILRRGEKLIPIETKWSFHRKLLPAIFQNFLKAHNIKEIYLISKDKCEIEKIGKVRFNFLYPWCLEYVLWKKE